MEIELLYFNDKSQRNATLKGRALSPLFISKCSLFLTREPLAKIEGVEGSSLYSYVCCVCRITLFHIHSNIWVVIMVSLSGFTLVSVLFTNSPAFCWSTGKTHVVFGSCQSSFLVNSFCFV